ncbi:MAG: tetratricopeptide repeat protein [Kiritimatiellae bacterium]|nr:tetratricopeptide repeat protein [Kiritimatiellia bacterium]
MLPLSGKVPNPRPAMKPSRLPASAAVLVLAALLAPVVAAPPAAAQQLGPYEIQTKGASFNAKFIKREKDTVWLRRIAPDGTIGPQVGYEKADIENVAMPPPAFFSNVYAMVASPTPPPASSLIRADKAIDAFIDTTRPYRDLPGIICDEAIFLKGQLLDLQRKYDDAIATYESLRSMNPPSPFATNALVRVGIDYQRTTNSLEAISCLSGVLLPEDDENLLSALLFALGDAFADVGNYDNALQSYLTLIVFYPYVRDNEPRALAKVLPCYAALKEWEPLYRAIQDIHATYPGSPAAAVADAIAKKYAKELGEAGLLVADGERVVEDAADGPLKGTTAATEAPEHTQLPGASARPDADTSPIADTVTYPDEL